MKTRNQVLLGSRILVSSEFGFVWGFGTVRCGKPLPQPGDSLRSTAGASALWTDPLRAAGRVFLTHITRRSVLQKLLGLVAPILRSALDKLMVFLKICCIMQQGSKILQGRKGTIWFSLRLFKGECDQHLKEDLSWVPRLLVVKLPEMRF